MRDKKDDDNRFYLSDAQKDTILKYVFGVGVVIIIVGVLILGKNTLGKSVDVFVDANTILEDYQDDVHIEGIDNTIKIGKE